MSEIMAIHPAALEALGTVNPAAAVDSPGKRRSAVLQAEGAAIVPITGYLGYRPSWIDRLFGNVSSIGEISHRLRELAADASVSSVVLDIYSPGGSVYGIQELANQIFELRKSRPIIAFVNPAAASAAYWLASQASEIVMLPSGEVGSVGVVSVHFDHSKQLAEIGIKPTYVYAGEHKLEGNPHEPLEKDAKAFLQKRVHEYYDAFVSAVARGRGVQPAHVRANFGQGRMLGARDAKAAGMVDRLAESHLEVLAYYGKKKPGMAAAIESMRRLGIRVH